MVYFYSFCLYFDDMNQHVLTDIYQQKQIMQTLSFAVEVFLLTGVIVGCGECLITLKINLIIFKIGKWSARTPL